MGFIIVIGGAIGTTIGIYTFIFKDIENRYRNFISLYVYFSYNWNFNACWEFKRNWPGKKKCFSKKGTCALLDTWPSIRMRFPKSKLYESIFTPIIIGLIVGFIAAIMGIGGAFILVPAMIYIIKMQQS